MRPPPLNDNPPQGLVRGRTGTPSSVLFSAPSSAPSRVVAAAVNGRSDTTVRPAIGAEPNKTGLAPRSFPPSDSAPPLGPRRSARSDAASSACATRHGAAAAGAAVLAAPPTAPTAPPSAPPTAPATAPPAATPTPCSNATGDVCGRRSDARRLRAAQPGPWAARRATAKERPHEAHGARSRSSTTSRESTAKVAATARRGGTAPRGSDGAGPS